MSIFSFGLLSEAEGREKGSWQSAGGEAVELGSSVTKKKKNSFNDSLFENLSELERAV